MRNRLSFRLLAGLSAAALLPLLVAGVFLMPALQQGALDLRLASTRTLAESVEPNYGGLLDEWIASGTKVREDPVIANPAADDATRLTALQHFAGTVPHLSGITVHRATGVALSTREDRAVHPDGATWARLGRGGFETMVRQPEGGSPEVSLVTALSVVPAGGATEILEFHIDREAMAGPVLRIQAAEVALVDDREQVLAHRNPAWIGRRFAESLTPETVLTVPVRTNGEGLARPWRVMVRIPQAEAAKLQVKAASILFLAGLLGVGVACLAGWHTVRWLNAPLVAAAGAVSALERKDFGVRLKDGGPESMTTLNRRLNSLAKKLEAFFAETQGQRERLEKRLSDEEARGALTALQVRAAGEGSRDGFLLLAGEEQAVSWWNPRFAQFGRFTENDLALLDARQIIQRVAWQFADSGRFLEWWHQAAARAEELTSQEWALRQPEDGAARVSVFRVKDAQGKPFGFIWRFEDRTEEARLQRQSRDVERAELIGNLTTGIAHEFNRILTSVVGDIAGLEQNLDAAEREQTISHARSAANQAAAICRGLLGYSRNHLLEARVNGVRSIIAWLKTQLSDGFGPEYTIQIELPEKNLHVTADRNRIRSVLLELCANAFRAMPHGGTLRVAAEPLQLANGEPDPADLEAGRFICFTVQDNGRGIPDDVRARIFEPFFTTDTRANGLGLAAVSGIVWQHGGWLTCASEEGQGTCMRVYLPASELPVTVVVEDAGLPLEARQVDAASPAGAMAVPEGDFVLVVDDEDGVRRLNQAILKRGGIASLGARSGEEALSFYRQYRDRITLIVLDLNMPGMSGAEMFRILRAEGSFVPVVVVSAYLLDFNAFAMDCGARPSGFVQKPYQADQFLQQVCAALEPAPAQDSTWARARA